MSLVLIALLPFLGAVFPALMIRSSRNASALAAGTVTVTALTLLLSYAPTVFAGEVVQAQFTWLPTLGLNANFFLDGLGFFFALLILAIGLLIIMYARFYLSEQDPMGLFYVYLLLFQGAMVGITLSDNILLLLIFWELTSLSSFLLIGYWKHLPEGRQGARMALAVTGLGGLALIGGMLILGDIAGSHDLTVILQNKDMVQASPLYLPALILILLGCFTKSAQFPFHFWLPHAMAAPTPVSAYLHSATMVKAGLFLMARLWPVLAGTPEWFYIVAGAGMITLCLGAFFAIFQHDLKGLLAYSTISHLGLITTLLGLSSPLAAVAAIFHMMNHATFKASLFMAAGVIDHETGTRDMRRLSGLYRAMPVTALLAMVASAAMAGVPLLNGFISKEMFFAETIMVNADSFLDRALPYVATVAGALGVAYSLRFIHAVFFGPVAVDLPREPHEPPHWMRFPIDLLVLGCLVIGIIPAVTIGPYLHVAVEAVLGAQTPEYSLSVWHGINTPLIMSTIALVAGVILYILLRGYLARSEEGPPLLRNLKGQRIFERVLVTVSWRWARWIETKLGTRRLQPQLRLLVGLTFVAAAWSLLRLGFDIRLPSLVGIDPVFAGLWIVGITCAVLAA